jgi:hypothetical protein
MYVWGRRNHDLSACTDELTAAGYKLRQISYTHASDIFVAERKDSADYEIVDNGGADNDSSDNDSADK